MPGPPVLSSEDHEFFLEHGFVIVRRAVPPAVIADAVAALETGTYTGSVGDADYRAVQSEAVSACVTDTVLDAIGELFGPAYPFVRSRNASDMPRPQEPHKDWPEPRAHVDDDYPTLMPNGWALGTFIFLTPVQSHGGAFVLFDGSYRRYQELMASTPDSIAGSAAAPHSAGAGEEFLAQPGDALLFHHLMGHSGSPNVSDPTTRHALLSRWHPSARIVPGDKGFDSMSTIEKANSPRYQAARSGSPLATPICATDSQALRVLRDGGALNGDIAAHALIHFQGVTHRFHVNASEPNVIQRAHSTDLLHWEADSPLPAQRGPVRSLAFHQRAPGVILVAGVGNDTEILASNDLQEWTSVTVVADAQQAAGHFSTKFGSQTARGQVLFYVPPHAPDQVRCRWARKWAEIGATEDEATVVHAPSGSQIVGLCLHPTLGESRYAVIVDVVETEKSVPQPFFALSADSASYPESLQSLAFGTPTPLRQIHVYRRTRDYWMVTYVREQEGQECLFWGEIDWEQSPVTLQEITSAEAWQRAFDITGLR